MSGLTYLTTDPPNAGMPLERLDGKPVGQDEMYIRSNFGLPESPPSEFTIVIPGQPTRSVAVDDLDRYRRIDMDLVLECAGNGRSLMSPVPEGTPWGLDAASFVSARGVHLADVLGPLPEEVVDVVFTGADRGNVHPEGEIPYQFSLSRELATSETPLLVTHIGDEPLTLLHGAPVRLLVPGHYGMKSVKWLTRIEAMTEPFEGHFVDKYRYYSDSTEPERAPVDLLRVRSVITSPTEGATLAAGVLEIRGTAWTGSGLITKVEVSIDGEKTWHPARLDPAENPFGATHWHVPISAPPGRVEIAARAGDSTGATQPSRPRWNRNGYGNNVMHRVTVEIS